ncbi:MAG: hypothetical protein ACWGQW_04200 [bacterium]
MTEYTYDAYLFSDFYKEVYGVRPRGHEFYTASEERAQEIWDQLMKAHKAEMERYYAEQSREMYEIGAQEERDYDAWARMCGEYDEA